MRDGGGHTEHLSHLTTRITDELLLKEVSIGWGKGLMGWMIVYEHSELMIISLIVY